MYRFPPPDSVEVLLDRARVLSGYTLAEVATWLGTSTPDDLRHAKGWMGQLIEAALGAPGGSRPEPDFDALGIELKTIPVRRDGTPRESTYVCVAPTEGEFEASWEESLVRKKLAHVLWIPIAGESGEAPGDRTLGAPTLWSPDPAETAVLAADWLMLSELLAGGELHRIHGRLGTSLQLRPKAANAQDYAWMLDQDGTWVRAVPYGFYLRTRFTAGILGRG